MGGSEEGESGRSKDEGRVEVLGIVEFGGAEGGERGQREAVGRGVGDAFGKGGGEREVAGGIGKFGQAPRRRRDIMLARKIAEREQQGGAAAPAAERAHDLFVARGRCHGGQGGVGAVGEETRDITSKKLGTPREERRAEN